MIYERVDTCPVCGSGLNSNFLICKDSSVSQESFAIVECKKCHFKYTSPRPTKELISKYYESDQYISHNNSNKSIIDNAYYLVRKITIQNKLRLVNSTGDQEKKILDIGCGTGTFLGECKKNGWQVYGTEPNDKARATAIELTRGKIEKDFQNCFEGETFNTITLWHVLEHIHLLNETITKIKKIMEPNGTLIIAVPNCDSYDANYFKENWAAYDVPRHLYHFSTETMKLLLQKHKLKIESIIPMKWDSYYISLLSTKNVEGNIDLVKGLKHGYASNQWAKENNNSYSSLTYLIKSANR